ncbi:MAG: T9SS type A sorting domain-containing protein [Bacteroidales bacterium]|nr:T9SS type A sorting domain-containing protein [Bacteroidales bacterium]MCF8389338.1 T9SS type A sorting domain-containing protein [Bacteroidales bacterium]
MDINLDSLLGSTDENGLTNIDMVDPGEYSFSANRTGYTPIQKSLVVSSDTTFIDTMEIERYELNFTVKNNDTGDAIENCKVVINDEIYFSNTDGRISISSLEYGTYPYYTEFPGFIPIAKTTLQIISDTTINLLIKAKENLITYRITDKTSGEPVIRAVISYSGNIKLTDGNGECSFNPGPVGTVVYSVSDNQGKYFPINDSLINVEDTTIIIQMIRTHANVIFRVFEGQNPLLNVDIYLNEYHTTTDDNGTAFLYNRPAKKICNYTISKTGYRTLEDSLYIEIDTTVNFQLELISKIDLEEAGNFKIFPNPADDLVFINSNTPETWLRVLDPNGKVLILVELEVGSAEIDVSFLPAGIYFINIWDQENSYYYKQIIY